MEPLQVILQLLLQLTCNTATIEPLQLMAANAYNNLTFCFVKRGICAHKYFILVTCND